MVALSRLLYYGILLPLSLLPFRVLYALSDVLFVFLYNITGYRKAVVLQNLRNSFPSMDESRLRRLAPAFYRHLADLVVESVKIFSISEQAVQHRFTCRNPEVMNALFDQGRSVILAGGHYNNWELFAVAIDRLIRHRTVAIYKPLKDVFLDGKMRQTRGKYGLRMIPIADVKAFFEHPGDRPTATIFAIDQSPSSSSRCHWMTFLNQETAVAFGAEKYARAYNQPVVFGRMAKLRRGHYELEFELAVPEPAACRPGEITETVTRMLEKDIVNDPVYWLWSHRRWKRKRQPGETGNAGSPAQPGT